jgi:hypothetical protein
MNMTKGDIARTAIHKDHRTFLNEALLAGWTVAKIGQYVTASSPDAQHVVRFRENGSGFVDQKLLRKYRRWLADSEANLAIDAIIAGGLTSPEPTMIDEVLAGAAMKHVRAAREPKIVLVKPFRARKNPGKDGGVLYDSEAVLERKWDDGTMDYACAADGCEFTSADNPRSVASHYGQKHVRSGEVEAVTYNPPGVAIDPDYTEPMSHRDYSPSDRLLDTLAAFLDSHGFATPEQAARWALTWFHDRPDLEDAERPNVGTVERTPEQILDKIRLLVGGRDPEVEARLIEAERDLAEARDHLTEQRTTIDGLTAALAEEKRQRAATESTLDALLDLVSSLRTEEKK